MSGITLAQAESKLTAHMNAIDAVMNGQEYKIGSRSLTRADLKALQDGVDYWQGWVVKLSRGGIRLRGGAPC